MTSSTSTSTSTRSCRALCNKNPLPEFDEHVTFDAATHTYKFNGKLLTNKSVSGLVAEWNTFDGPSKAAQIVEECRNYARKKAVGKFLHQWQLDKLDTYGGKSVDDLLAEWDAAGVAGRERGTALHALIAVYYDPYSNVASAAANEVTMDERAVKSCAAEFVYFAKFDREVIRERKLVPVRIEMAICHLEAEVGGTVDALFAPEGDTSNQNLELFDWKTGSFKREFDKQAKPMPAPFDRLLATTAAKHCAQATIYKVAIELATGWRIRKVYIVMFEKTRYELLPVDDMQAEVLEFFAQLASQRSLQRALEMAHAGLGEVNKCMTEKRARFGANATVDDDDVMPLAALHADMTETMSLLTAPKPKAAAIGPAAAASLVVPATTKK